MTQKSNLDNSTKQHIDLVHVNIPQSLQEKITHLGYKNLTSFQNQIISLAQERKNILAYGSAYGKSLAFNLSIITTIDITKKSSQSLIITPNMLQAEMIEKELNNLTDNQNCAGIYNKKEENKIIIICTYEQLNEAIQNINFNDINIVFLDGIGVENTNNTLRYLLEAKKSLQCLIFSPTNIDIIHSYRLESIENVCLVENNHQPVIIKPCLHIAHQQNENLPKPRTLLAVIENHKKDAYLITCNNQDECFLLDRFLARYGHEIRSITDERSQDISKSIDDLVNKKISILICPSDFLVSQDLSHVEYIINYNIFDKPSVYEQVTQFNKQAAGVHRTIINIVSSRELGFLTSLKSQCNIIFEHQTLPNDEEIINLSAKRIINFINKQAQDVELGQFIELTEKILKDNDATLAIAFLIKEHFLKRATASLRPALEKPREYKKRDFKENNFRENKFRKNHTEEPGEQEENKPLTTEAHTPKERAPRAEQVEVTKDALARLYVSLGQNDGFDDLATLAQFLSEKSNIDLGHFSGGGMVREQSAHVEVDEEVAQAIIDAVNNQEKPNKNDGNDVIVCERAKQQSFKPRFQKKPYRNNYKRN